MKTILTLAALILSSTVFAEYFDFETEFEIGTPGAQCDEGEILLIGADVLICYRLGSDDQGEDILSWELAGGYEPDFGPVGVSSHYRPSPDELFDELIDNLIDEVISDSGMNE